jgi:hypothetical protein
MFTKLEASKPKTVNYRVNFSDHNSYLCWDLVSIHSLSKLSGFDRELIIISLHPYQTPTIRSYTGEKMISPWSRQLRER